MLRLKKTMDAIRQLESELQPLEVKSEDEIRHSNTKILGYIRRELIKECRRKLLEISLTTIFGRSG